MGGDGVTSIDIDMATDISISKVEARKVMVVMVQVGTTSQIVLMVLKVIAGMRVITPTIVIDIDLKRLHRFSRGPAMLFDMSSTRSGQRSLYRHGWPTAGSERLLALSSDLLSLHIYSRQKISTAH